MLGVPRIAVSVAPAMKNDRKPFNPRIAMSSTRCIEACSLDCPWKNTGMCAQRLRCAQALAERRLSLGVMCGLKQIYHRHGLPPCVVGDSIAWSQEEMEAAELACAA
jgi:hypothetical protein